MKYLDYPELESLSRALTFESAECKVFTRLEAYSCKAVTKEKRLYKALEDAYHQTASTSPPDYLEESLASPFGRLDQPNARKTLFLLIALLNGAFPDHDFSQVNPSDFRKETSSASVLHSLSSTLHSLRNNSSGPRSYSTFTGSFDEAMNDHSGQKSFSLPDGNGSGRDYATRSIGAVTGVHHAGLASLLDDIMDIRECDVYTFHPDMDSDPHACAEPDEEGLDFDDPSGGWNEDGDASMQSVNVLTPRRGSAELDAPLFDEDLDGGFDARAQHPSWAHNGMASSSGAYADSDGPHTPQTSHTSAVSATTTPRKGDRGQKAAASSPAAYVSSSLSSTSSIDVENDDDVDGTGGLLWSTYAFFYNRRLKRMLFVSVWSRMNSVLTGGGEWTSPLTTFAPNMAHPPNLRLPSSVASSKTVFQQSMRGQADPSAGNTSSSSASSAAAVASSSGKDADPSPAKMAISRATSGRGGRKRVPSGSPAPSSLSPFPHASPRTPGASSSGDPPDATASRSSALRSGREPGPANGRGPAVTGGKGRTVLDARSSVSTRQLSLDAAALSISAPATVGAGSARLASSTTRPTIHEEIASASSPTSASGVAPAAKRTADGDESGGKRTRRQVVP